MTKIIKKLLAISLIIFISSFLNACGSTQTVKVQKLETYEANDFTIDIDPSWKIINQSDFYSEVPKETLIAFTTPEAYDGFFINVSIVKEDLKQHVSSVDYGRANINLSSQNLTDYEKIQEVNIKIGEEDALLHIFQARLNPSEKLIKFIQLYAVKDNYGYIVSGGMLPDTPKEIRDLLGSIVTSFKLK